MNMKILAALVFAIILAPPPGSQPEIDSLSEAFELRRITAYSDGFRIWAEVYNAEETSFVVFYNLQAYEAKRNGKELVGTDVIEGAAGYMKGSGRDVGIQLFIVREEGYKETTLYPIQYWRRSSKSAATTFRAQLLQQSCPRYDCCFFLLKNVRSGLAKNNEE
jgi:hypothetical protein